MKNKNKRITTMFLRPVLAAAVAFACLPVFTGCGNDDDDGGNKLTSTGYAKSGGGSKSIYAPVAVFRSGSDGVYNSNAYRSFPIDNHGVLPVTDRTVTVEAILQFERDVPGYNDDPADYVGYFDNHSSYPSNAHVTKEEGVYLVFDSRDPSKRYQVGYLQINLQIENSNLTSFEDLIAQGKPISLFHVDNATMMHHPTCWAIQWIPEDDGGIPGSLF